MDKPTKQEIKKATQAVDNYRDGSFLGKNLKYLEDGETLQMKIGATLRVRFKPKSKEIIDVFKKGNHKSHR